MENPTYHMLKQQTKGLQTAERMLGKCVAEGNRVLAGLKLKAMADPLLQRKVEYGQQILGLVRPVHDRSTELCVIVDAVQMKDDCDGLLKDVQEFLTTADEHLAACKESLGELKRWLK